MTEAVTSLFVGILLALLGTLSRRRHETLVAAGSMPAASRERKSRTVHRGVLACHVAAAVLVAGGIAGMVRG